MLKFYKNISDEFTDLVEQKLEDMVIAHKIMTVADTKSLPEHISLDDLPLLSDTHHIWKTREEIEVYLEELDQEIKLGRSLQSDSCYIDPDNPERCL